MRWRLRHRSAPPAPNTPLLLPLLMTSETTYSVVSCCDGHAVLQTELPVMND
jgi:hypothetical protein